MGSRLVEVALIEQTPGPVAVRQQGRVLAEAPGEICMMARVVALGGRSQKGRRRREAAVPEARDAARGGGHENMLGASGLLLKLLRQFERHVTIVPEEVVGPQSIQDGDLLGDGAQLIAERVGARIVLFDLLCAV